MPQPRSILLPLTQYLLLSAILSVLLSAALAAFLNPFNAPAQTSTSFDGRHTLTLCSYARPGLLAILTSRNTPTAWAVHQATGPPNTPTHGDHQTAWASASTDSPSEWLELTFDHPVLPSHLLIHESYNPGAVSRILAYNFAGQPVEVWQGIAPSPPDQSHHISHIPLTINFPTNRIRIELNSVAVPGWNEIDAVALVDHNGNTQWATSARASSAYAAGTLSSTTPSLPHWLDPHPANDATPRLTLAYGFPFPAFITRPTPTTVSLATTPIKPFPTRLNLPGLLANTAILAVTLFSLRLLLTYPHRFLRESSRIRRGCCLSCGYNLRYDFTTGCPECGWRRA